MGWHSNSKPKVFSIWLARAIPCAIGRGEICRHAYTQVCVHVHISIYIYTRMFIDMGFMYEYILIHK